VISHASQLDISQDKLKILIESINGDSIKIVDDESIRELQKIRPTSLGTILGTLQVIPFDAVWCLKYTYSNVIFVFFNLPIIDE